MSAKACTSMSTCVDVLSKGLHRSVRGPLIRRSMTGLLSGALEMGGCVLGGNTYILKCEGIIAVAYNSGASFKHNTSRHVCNC